VKSPEVLWRDIQELDSHPIVFNPLHPHQVTDRSRFPLHVIYFQPEILPSYETFFEAQPASTKGQVKDFALGHS
jgi:hypothetical protein